MKIKKIVIISLCIIVMSLVGYSCVPLGENAGNDTTTTKESESATTEDTESSTISTAKNTTKNKTIENKDDVKNYAIHNIFNDDISQISDLTIGNPIVVDDTTYYGIIYNRNNGVKLLCFDYTHKRTLSYDEMDKILSPLGKSYWDLQN